MMKDKFSYNQEVLSMFSDIAYFSIFGIYVVRLLGISALILMLFTASISILNRRKIRWIHFKWHSRFAYVTIILALCHGLLVFLSKL
jgi:hypothetical protein